MLIISSWHILEMNNMKTKPMAYQSMWGFFYSLPKAEIAAIKSQSNHAVTIWPELQVERNIALSGCVGARVGVVAGAGHGHQSITVLVEQLNQITTHQSLLTQAHYI